MTKEGEIEGGRLEQSRVRKQAVVSNEMIVLAIMANMSSHVGVNGYNIGGSDLIYGERRPEIGKVLTSVEFVGALELKDLVVEVEKTKIFGFRENSENIVRGK